MIVPIIGDIIFSLCGINAMSLHDAKETVVDVDGILAHDDPASHIVLACCAIPLGLSDAFYGIAVYERRYRVSGLTSRMALSISLLSADSTLGISKSPAMIFL